MSRALLATLLLATACTSGGAATSSARASAGAAPSAVPTLTETFTPGPCDDSTDVGEAACLEAQVIASDQQVNGLVAKAWSKADATDRAKLARAEVDWRAFRASFCDYETDQYRGGSIVPVVLAQCLADLTAQHVKDLTAAQPEG